MFKNYLKIAWRNVLKSKAFSIINILGLSLGISCSLLIFLWVYDEYTIDSSHENLDRIYSVTSQEYVEGAVTGSYDTPGLLAGELKRVLPEVALACGYGWNQHLTFSSGEKTVKLEGNYAGADFFKIFSFPLLQGSKESALNAPDAVAISQKMAVLLFGSPENAINQAVKFENYKDLRVTAIFEDLPANISERFEYLLNWDLYVEREPWVENWHNSGPRTYVMLTADTHPRDVEAKIRTFIANYDKEYRESDRLELGLQPYAEKYLHSNFKNGKISGGRIEYVMLFSLVALFVLLIACINFTNLSTARSIKRAREIGVRKVLGAIRTAVMKQFLTEALLYTILALTISILLVTLLLPSFNELSGKTIVLPWNNPLFWAGLLLLTLVTGLCAGSYPAFLLSSLKSLTALKGNLNNPTGPRWLGKGLVIFQFVLSIVFIAGMMVISKQVTYTQTKNLGYNKSNLLYLPITGTLATHFSVFKNDALELPGIKGISRISQPPVQIDNSTVGVEWAGKDPDTKINFTQVAVGYDFIKTMGSGIVLGRDFSPDFADRENYLINETALKKIGYSDPIGKPLTFWEVPGTIIGVVRDFHFNSLHVPIAPLVIRMTGEPSGGTALIRADPGRTKLALEGLERLHQELNPDFPFAYQFADEEYAFLYNSELVAEKISRVFAFLAIFISCLGLLGLVLFASELRAREIGIRKVLGASVPALLKLLSKDYLVLIGLAFTIATPLAWMLMQNWLDNFEYKVGINWLLLFAITGIVVVLVAIATVGYQTLKVALANPVKSLRTE